MEEGTRHVLDRALSDRRSVGVWLVRDGADRVVTQSESAGWHDEALDRVAVEVAVLVDRQGRRRRPGFAHQPVAGIRTWADLDRDRSRGAHVVGELTANPQ